MVNRTISSERPSVHCTTLCGIPKPACPKESGPNRETSERLTPEPRCDADAHDTWVLRKTTLRSEDVDVGPYPTQLADMHTRLRSNGAGDAIFAGRRQSESSIASKNGQTILVMLDWKNELTQ